MYPNLRAEMARKGVTGTEIANVIGRTKSTLSQKLGKEDGFTLLEAEKIKAFLNVDMTIDELFKREES